MRELKGEGEMRDCMVNYTVDIGKIGKIKKVRGNNINNIIIYDYSNHKRGFTILELVLGMVVFLFLIGSIYFLTVSFSAQMENAKTRMNLTRLAEGIKKTANVILSLYIPKCTQTYSSVRFGWGWKNSRCQNTRLFPRIVSVGGIDALEFTYDRGVLSPDEENILKSSIRSFFGDFCKIEMPSAGVIRVICPQFKRIRYCTGNISNCNDLSKLKTDVHTPGHSYDYINNRIVALVVEYDELDRKGEPSIHHRIGYTRPEGPAILDFEDFNQKMDQKNYRKFVDLYNAIKKYETTKRVLELKATAPNGLDEVSDYFVPWVYQVTASSPSRIFTVCRNTSCSNLRSTSYWRNNLSSTDMYTILDSVIRNLMHNDRTYMVDAWNNPIGVELLINYASPSCTRLYDGTGANQCRWNNPPFPQSNYERLLPANLRPPYLGYIYSQFCVDLRNPKQDFCRLMIVYSN